MRRRTLPGRRGLSMLELLIAMVMITVLVVSAFMSWGAYVDDARLVSTKNRLDTLRKALEAWRADNLRPYPKHDLTPLLGRYISAEEDDGWGFPYAVDPYFLRIISRGRDGLLDTPVPGLDDSPIGGHGGDDLIEEAQENGRIVINGANGTFSIRPDGRNLVELADTSPFGDVSPGSGVFVWNDGAGAYWRNYLTPKDSIGSGLLSTQEAIPMTWLTTPTLTASIGAVVWGNIAVAPDGLRVAYLALDGSAQVRMFIGEVVPPRLGMPPGQAGTGAPAYLAATFPAGDLSDGETSHMSWNRDGGSLYLSVDVGADVAVRRVRAAPRSRHTSLAWGHSPGETMLSADFCGSIDRMVVLSGAAIYLGNSNGRSILPHPASAPPANPVKLAINRRGDAVAVLDGANSLWVWWPDRPSGPGTGNPFEIARNLNTTVGAITDLRWR